MGSTSAWLKNEALWMLGEGDGHRCDHREREHPGQQKQGAAPQSQSPGYVGLELPEADDQGHHQVRKHRHLHQADVDVGDGLQG